jgi:histidinol-phosphate aminotransferase
MNEITSLVRKNILELKPYSTARNEYKGRAKIMLDANENPFPSLAGEGLERYPDPLQIQLREAFAEMLGVKSRNVFIGNGSDEAIDLLIRIFCSPGKDEVIIATPTYGMYQVSAALNEASLKEVSLGKNFELIPEDILKAHGENTKLIFLCSPNNPTGNLLGRAEILEVIERTNSIVAVDEAYMDFADGESLVKDIGRSKRLVVLRTFSKAFGAAGIRAGAAIGSEELIELLDKVKPPYNLSRLAADAAMQLLRKKDLINERIRQIKDQRKLLIKELESINGVEKIFPSQANFLLVRFRDSRPLFLHLMQRGIIVRDRSSNERLKDCLRITVGTEDENRELIEEIRKFYRSA